jgi:type I restriction enzyme, S subunit
MNKENAKRELPAGWKWIRLGDVCEIIAGQSPPGTTYRNSPEGLPFFQGKADFGKLHPIARVWCVEPIKIAQPEDILISVRAPIGPTNIADVECCIGRGLAAIRCGDNTDRDFILNTMRRFEANLVKKGSGSTFGAIIREDLELFEIPLPPINEQHRIAGILRKQLAEVEKAQSAAKQRLEAIKAMPATFLRQVIPDHNQVLPTGWKLIKLGEVCQLKTGGTPSKAVPEYYGGVIKWLVSGDINRKEIFDCEGRITEIGLANSNASLLPADCVMIALNGQGKTRGTVALLNTEAACNQSLVALIPRDRNELWPRFLLHQLQMRYQELRNLTGDNHRSGLNMAVLNRLSITLPTFDEQKRIANTLRKQMSEVEKVREMAQAELDVINTLPTILIRQALDGEI